jgi:flagellar basal-body rod protein FlgG
MFSPLYIAATGLNAYEDEMVSITNNLANAKTIGFKRGKTEMESLFYLDKTFQKRLSEQTEQLETTASPNAPIEFGTGVRIAATPKDFEQGQMEVTSSPFDIAIQGEGFLQYKLPDGTIAFGRAGNLHVDNEGNLVDPNGRFLEPGIAIPERTTNVVIRQDGTVLVNIDNQMDQMEVGQITIARFTNLSGLKAIGQNLFVQTPSSGEPIIGIPNEEGFGYVNQYSLESSNVDVISEMMQMLMVQRVFDTVSKAVQAYDGMMTALGRIKQ